MNRVRHQRGATALVIGVLAAVVAVCAMFTGTRGSAVSGAVGTTARSARPGERDGAWWLGADLDPGAAASPVEAGARVKRVWSHSPARAAGLAKGDVVVRVNGVAVTGPADVEALLSAPGAPKRIGLVISRGGRRSSVQVALREKPNFALNIGVTLSLLAAVFALLYFTPLDRVAVLGCGAVLSVLVGTGLGFYDQGGAFEAIRMGPLALLLGMGLITAALEETGFFAVVARRIGGLARGDWSRLMVLLCVTTFFLSSYVNNLTTILVILPVTLRLARELGFDPAPFVIGEIVSSNLGGASSMIGDFPNMLIASETGRHYHEFLLYMTPPCLVELAIMVWFMHRMKGAPAGAAESRPPVPEAKAGTSGQSLRPDRAGTRAALPAPGKMKQALGVLTAVFAAFFFCGRFDVPPATVALAGGFAILLLWNRAAPRLIVKGGFGDILFFAGLFALVGCAGASGLLDIIATWVATVSGGSPLGLALVLMWGAAVVTTFLNAGPTTALFVPVVTGLGVSEPHGLLWWALSLGVCAGSSATITGATAGPVALTKLEESVKGAEEGEPAARPGRDCEAVRTARPVELSFASYARVGVPLMFIFLLVSSAYVWALSVWI